MKTTDIKKFTSDKKLFLIFGSVVLNIALLFTVLYFTFDENHQNRKGYIREWYGRGHVVSKDIFKSHTDRMKTLQHNLKTVLIQDDLEVKELRSVLKDINDEREKFHRIVEDNMVEKLSTIPLKEREKFVRKMSDRKEKFEKRSRKNSSPKAEKSKEGKRSYVRKGQRKEQRKEIKEVKN